MVNQEGKTNLNLLEQETVSGSGISWAICKSAPQTDNHAVLPPLSFLQAGCPSRRPTNSVKALKYITYRNAATGGTSHDRSQHAQKFGEVWPRGFRDMQIDRLTNTNRLVQIID